jgi:hypothetical protein
MEPDYTISGWWREMTMVSLPTRSFPSGKLLDRFF